MRICSFLILVFLLPIHEAIVRFEETSNNHVRIETCANTPLKGTDFCDKTKPYAERLKYVVDQLTLEEKIGMLDRYNPYLERFNISYYNFRCVSLHGLSDLDSQACSFGPYHVVVYPEVINLGRTFNMSGIVAMTTQISDSARAFYNAGLFEGLSMFRDPRWGRLMENAGEDPFLVGEYIKAYLKGMQEGEDPRYIKTVATVKHYTAYDLDRWNGVTRHTFDAIVSKYAKSIEEACVLTLRAGMDLNDGIVFSAHLKSAIDKGLMDASELNEHVERILERRFELGEFDSPWSEQTYFKIPVSVINSQKHKDLSYELALQSLVMLKNEDDILPLAENFNGTIGVIGPHIDSRDELLGSHVGTHDFVQSPLEVLSTRVTKILSSKGCEDVACESTLLFDEAKIVAKNSDVVILFVGLSMKQEHEDMDRLTLTFPGLQSNLIKLISENAKKVIMVLIKGGALDLTFEKFNPIIGGILDAGYPGQFGAKAIFDTIFGDNSPAGKLSYTVYPADYVKIPMTDMRMRPDSKSGYPGRTYRFYTGDIVYKFGYGLSYTDFLFQWFGDKDTNSLDVTLGEDFLEKVSKILQVNVTNIGLRSSDVVVLCFISNESMQDSPIKELIGFRRISLNVGEHQIVDFQVKRSHFEYVTENGRRVFVPGKYVFSINIDDLERVVDIVG